MKILITGTAGFIGFYLTRKLSELGHEIVGIDCINDYYDVQLKKDRLAQTGIAAEAAMAGGIVQSSKYPGYRFLKLALEDRAGIDRLFARENFDTVCNLAAQAGVRYSLENPYAYIQSNVVGFLNLLEACRHNGVRHFLYASSSSVYGGNTKTPYSEDDRTDTPVSLYAATKKADELMAHTYTHLYGFAATGLRFFTVYGPWGRPDMAPMLFTKNILAGKPIRVFNNGNLSRDFTYIDDIIDGVERIIARPPEEAVARIYNIGCSHPVKLMDFIGTLETALGRKAAMEMCPMQQGDVFQTYADTTRLERDYGYKPATDLKSGIGKFAAWYENYYKQK